MERQGLNPLSEALRLALERAYDELRQKPTDAAVLAAFELGFDAQGRYPASLRKLDLNSAYPSKIGLGASDALLERLRGRVRMTERHAEATSPTGSAPNADYHARALVRLDAYRCCLADAEDPAYGWRPPSWQKAYAAYAKYPEDPPSDCTGVLVHSEYERCPVHDGSKLPSPPPCDKLHDDACECIEIPPAEGERGSFRERRVPPQGCLVHGRPSPEAQSPPNEHEKRFLADTLRGRTVRCRNGRNAGRIGRVSRDHAHYDDKVVVIFPDYRVLCLVEDLDPLPDAKPLSSSAVT